MKLEPGFSGFLIGFFSGVFVSGVVAVVFLTNPFEVSPGAIQKPLTRQFEGASADFQTSACLETFPKNNLPKININHASIEELSTLPGIGESKASRIVEFRLKYGDYESIDELLFVSGISEKLFLAICNQVLVSQD
jgi:competence ComEA-like helix-hairpin-helix protein